MTRFALLVCLLLAGCARDAEHAPGMVERELHGASVDGAEWTAHFIGDTLKTIKEKSKPGDELRVKNVYWFDQGSLRLYDSQRDLGFPVRRSITLHVLFDSAGQVSKFSKREDGRAVAVEPAEAEEALTRAALLAAEARKAAGVPAAR